MISSQLPLYEKQANGNANFQTAVEHIVKGIRPNVYVAYRNDEAAGESAMYLHLASHLLQCPSHSDCFYSSDAHLLENGEFFPGTATEGDEALLYRLQGLKNCVLKLEPYVGIDYSRFRLKGIRAVLHHTYHSATVATNPYHKKPSAQEEGLLDFSKDSILHLKKCCDAAGAELYIEPCDREKAYRYDTTGIVLRNGVGSTWRMTSEMTYVKLLLGCSLGYCAGELQAFMDREINGEFVR